MKIEGIHGDVADVNADGQLFALVTNEKQEATVSRLKGDTYSWSNVTYDYVAANTILGIENNSPNKYLVIDKVWLYGDVATQVKLHILSNVTMAGTAVTGQVLNRESRKTASATAKANETGNAVANIIANPYIPAAGESTLVDLKGAVILGEDDMFGIDYVTEGAVANVTVLGHFVDIPD